MGRSLSVHVVYGWAVEDPEGVEWPWAEEDEDGDLEDWWLERSGFDLPSPYARNGNDLRPGVSEADKMFWWDCRHAWLKDHPCPIELEHGGTDGYSPPLVVRPAGETFDEYHDGWEAIPLPERLTVYVGADVAAIEAARELIVELELQVETEFQPFIIVSYS